MNCDQAFDAMTDPVGPDNPELSLHLDACPRCRQMFETLEPALGLFAAVDGETGDVPSAASEGATASSVQMAQQLAGRLTPAGSVAPPRPPRRQLWGALFAAAAAGLLVSVTLNSGPWSAPSAFPGPANGCLWRERASLPDNLDASRVVVACAACHHSPSDRRRDEQSGVIDFSRELERLFSTGNAPKHPISHDQPLIASYFTKGLRHV